MKCCESILWTIKEDEGSSLETIIECEKEWNVVERWENVNNFHTHSMYMFIYLSFL